MQEEIIFTPGKLYMSKLDNRKVYTYIKSITDEKGFFVDANNKEHDLYLLTLEPYKPMSLF